jgi:ribosomal protein S18 acetylase RimI-like enzyme
VNGPTPCPARVTMGAAAPNESAARSAIDTPAAIGLSFRLTRRWYYAVKVQSRDLIIEPIGGDLLAFAQCCALDATVFPHSSLPVDSTHAVLVAREEERGPVIGFAATQRLGRRIAVIGLAVDARHRRRGLGAALLSRVVELAQDLDLREVALHVAVKNEAAIALYDREGFRPVRRLRGFYRTGDAWEMVKRL